MKKSATLTELLCQIKDKRRKQGTRHAQSDILLIVIMATMSGFYGYRSMEDFCKRYQEALIQVLKNPKHGLASYSAIRRVIMELDFNIVANKFHQWIRGKVSIRKREWMQIDGKGIKGTLMNYNNKYQRFVTLVSLFMDRTGVVLNAEQMNNKDQSEISVVQQLIDALTVKNIILSMDAIHCQKKTLHKILASGNDYVVKVKRNQKSLFDDIQQIQESEKSLTSAKTSEINRGRKEERTVKTYRVNDKIMNDWHGAKTVVYIKRERNGAVTHSYYLSSLSAKAEEFAKGIRQHWGIENRLHYVKDVTFKEDISKIKSGNAPGIFSLIRNLIINIVRIRGENRIKKFIRQCSGNIVVIASFLE